MNPEEPEMCAACDYARVRDEVVEKDTEIARLRAALELYGEHAADCEAEQARGSNECICGLDAHLVAPPEKPHE